MLKNGEQWKDTNENVINAHGGGLLKDGDYYYLFGENRYKNKKVSCYRSKDLMNWEFRNDVLTIDSADELIHSNIERPKVLYNESTGLYIMWMHFETDKDYCEARCAVATCTTIDGKYTYRRSFRPLGHMSRDCTLFKDENETAYFISAARNNADLNIYRLTKDYLGIEELVATLWVDQYREAPCLIKRGKYFFMVTSACTGWKPNQCKYAYSKSIAGPWSELINLGDKTTYDTQPTYIIPTGSSEAPNYIYLGDRWDAENYFNSSYAYLPISFPDEKSMSLSWTDNIEINVLTGEYKTK